MGLSKKSHDNDVNDLKQIIEEKNNEIGELKAELQKISIAHEDDLQEVKDYYENIIALLPGHVYWMDRNNIFLGCNDQQAKSAGLSSRKEIVGKTNFDMLWRNQAEALNKLNNEVMQTGEPHTAEEYAVMADGPRIYLSQKVPLRNKEGEIIGILGISFNITDRKNLEEALRVAKEKAEESNKLKTQFIQNMEHDIRTPFNGIYGLANILYQHNEGLSEEEKHEMLGDIVASAKLLLSYCNNILNFGKMELGELPLIAKKFELKKLAEEVISMEKPAAKAKNLQLILDCPNIVPNILIGDEYRLQQVLINLIGNAIKFTQEGEVRLIIEIADQKDKMIFLKLIVQDTGIGIPQDKQLLVYEKFTRLDPSNRGIYKGLGLGLSIVRQYVIGDMGGEIDLKSEIGKGTTFICTLPFRLPLVDKMV